MFDLLKFNAIYKSYPGQKTRLYLNPNNQMRHGS